MVRRRPGLQRVSVGLLFFLVVALSGCVDPPTATVSSDPTVKTIAVLRAVPGTPATVPAFLDELKAAGFSQGLNLSLLAGDAEEAYPDPEAARVAVEAWYRQGVDVIVAFSTDGARVAREAAPAAQVLFISNDPLSSGLVGDEQRPQGNVTGVSFRVPADRTLDVARRLISGLESVGLPLPDGDDAADAHRATVNAATDRLGLNLVVESFVAPEGAAGAVGRLDAAGVEALLLSNSPSASQALAETTAAAAELGMPVIASTPLAEGALMTLAPDLDELGRQLGRQAVRLLSGSSVESVPVEDPRRFLLTIDVSVADRLGIDIGDDLLQEANLVITS